MAKIRLLVCERKTEDVPWILIGDDMTPKEDLLDQLKNWLSYFKADVSVEAVNELLTHFGTTVVISKKGIYRLEIKKEKK